MKRTAAIFGLVLLALAASGAAFLKAQHEGHSDRPKQDPHAEHRAGAEKESGVPGYTPVPLTPELVQKFGVRTMKAVKEPMTQVIRTVGLVRTDETRESRVHTKWEGWIEEFFASYVGQSVRKGDPLFSVYSPDLVTAQQELVLAARAAEGRQGTPVRQALEAARAKLKLWDVPESLIREVEKTGEPRRVVTIRAPRDGVVVTRAVTPGMFVEPSMELYVIADLSRVWVLADLYEYEIPRIEVGQKAEFAPVGGADEAFQATVAFIPPTVAPATRTVKVRLELPNDPPRLRPGEYGTVRIKNPLPPAIVIPTDAVIETGTRQVVFVHAGGGRYEPRSVRLGPRAGGRVQVLEGIRDGEEVVVRAQFMLDSESRLRAAAAEGGKPGHGGH